MLMKLRPGVISHPKPNLKRSTALRQRYLNTTRISENTDIWDSWVKVAMLWKKIVLNYYKFVLNLLTANFLIWSYITNIILTYVMHSMKKVAFTLWKLITFYPNKQIWPNKLIKFKLSDHDNTQFVLNYCFKKSQQTLFDQNLEKVGK